MMKTLANQIPVLITNELPLLFGGWVVGISHLFVCLLYLALGFGWLQQSFSLHEHVYWPSYITHFPIGTIFSGKQLAMRSIFVPISKRVKSFVNINYVTQSQANNSLPLSTELPVIQTGSSEPQRTVRNNVALRSQGLSSLPSSLPS